MTTKKVEAEVVFEGKYCHRDCYALVRHHVFLCRRVHVLLENNYDKMVSDIGYNVFRCPKCIEEFGE